jgi:P27 family predicted phage terminase small subunit
LANRPGTTRKRGPSSLGAAGQSLWKRLTADFLFEDGAAVELLERACRAADRAEEARQALERTGGPVVFDRFGRPVRNPAVIVERDATTLLLQCLRMLGVDEVGPKNVGGRPVGS